MTPLELEFVYTADEAKRGHAAALKNAPRWLRLLPVLPAVVVIAIAGLWILSIALSPREDDNRWPLVVAVAVVAPFVIWRARAQTRKAQMKNFRKSPDADKPVHWTVHDDRVEIRAATSSTEFAASVFTKVHEGEHGFLLYTQSRLAHWLPRVAFPSEAAQETFRAWVRGHNLPLTADGG